MKDLIYFSKSKHLMDVNRFFKDLVEAEIHRLVLGSHMGGMSLLEASTIHELKGLLSQYGIATPAIHGLFRNQYDLNSEDPRFLVDRHITLLNHASELGVKTYVVHCGLPVEGRPQTDEWDYVNRAIEALLPVASANDIIIALENLPPEYLGSNPDDLVTVVEAFDSDHLGLCFDSGHAHMCGDAVDILKRMSTHVVTMHLHDNDGTSDIHLSPGDGTLDWDALVPEIHRCPNTVHLEIESFNREGRSHSEMWALYKVLLEG